MKRFWRLMGEMVETGVAYAPVAGAGAPSPYTPDITANIVGLRVICGRQTASSLINDVQIRLVSTTFVPNTIHICAVGTGLQTAPATEAIAFDYEVNQPVISGVPITIEGRNLYANAVTPDILIMGLFEVA